MAAANSFGDFFRVTTFGESHGAALGCVIDGCPAGVAIDLAKAQAALDRRRPGQAAWVSARAEPDAVEILSGLYEGKTLGTPIAMLIRNRDARSDDYRDIAQAVSSGGLARPGHADDVWRQKFGHTDPRGGGRASGRETAARVMAGAVAEAFVSAAGATTAVIGFASAIGEYRLTPSELAHAREAADRTRIDGFAARFPSADRTQAVEALLLAAVKDGRSHGGEAEIVVRGAPAGLGQPVFHKLKADLAAAYFGIGAVCAVELGDGFSATTAEGTQFHAKAETATQYGGIRGGISTGESILARIGFKPTSTVMDLAKRGRHDPCIVPRAIPVLEAMTWLVLAEHVLAARLDRIETQIR